MDMSKDNDIVKKVVEVLKQIYDPELPVNIYDLGLVYNINVSGDVIVIDMSLTTPTCPIAGVIISMVRDMVYHAFNGRYKVRVNLVWDPPWSPERVSEEGRKKLREIFGYDIVGEWIKASSSGNEE